MANCGERVEEKTMTTGEGAVHRYLGLSLGGAKSNKTCLTVLDFYRKQKKAFVVESFLGIGSEKDDQADSELTADDVLLSLVDELSKDLSKDNSAIRIVGVDAPLTLPPCLLGCDVDCRGYSDCKKEEIQWMNDQYLIAKENRSKLKHFTPYSQRPVDLYFRYKYPDENLFQDETMGANLAPQAARMNYLKRHLEHLRLIEVWPKLSLYHIHESLNLTKTEVLNYRDIEEGVTVREKIIERLVEKASIFIYERDLKKFITNVGAFDSFLCAWSALQTDLNSVVKIDSDLPVESGWIQIPEL